MRCALRLAVVMSLAAVPTRAAQLEISPVQASASAPSAAAAHSFAYMAPSPIVGPVSPGLPAAPVLPVPAAKPSPLDAPRPADARPTVLESASAPLPNLSGLSGGESAAAAEKDFAARAQMDAPAAEGAPVAVAGESRLSRFLTLVKGRLPAAEREMSEKIVPMWLRTELPVASAKLGQNLSAKEQEGVLARTKVWVYGLYSRWTYEISGGLPDGHYDPRFGIRVMLKMDWRRLKDPQTHFRVLYAHEYTHQLQEEGLVTRRYGVEIPAVAVEQLRALELVGWEGMKAGKVGFIAEGNRRAFEDGREWARGDMSNETALMYRGVLGGAAYEVGLIAGRPEAAWEFLNLVIAEKGGMKPRAAFEFVTGLRK